MLHAKSFVDSGCAWSALEFGAISLLVSRFAGGCGGPPLSLILVRETSHAFGTPHLQRTQVATKYVKAGESMIFEGIPTQNGIQEFLFSLPRYVPGCLFPALANEGAQRGLASCGG